METKKTPRVSIIMPTQDRAAELRRAILSVRKQTFSDWELIVIDDGSNDGTPAMLAEFAKNDPRISFIRRERQPVFGGIAPLLDQGIAQSRGEFIARLDDDDFWIDEKKLEKQIAFLDAHPDYVVVGGGVALVDSNEKELSRYLKKETDEEIRKRALFANPFSHTTTVFRADAAREAGLYEGVRFAEDWDLWLRMGQSGKFYNFPEYFTGYTMSGENKSLLYLRPQTEQILKFIVKYRHAYPGFFLAYIVNGLQWLYSLIPLRLKQMLHPLLASLKRRSF